MQQSWLSTRLENGSTSRELAGLKASRQVNAKLVKDAEHLRGKIIDLLEATLDGLHSTAPSTTMQRVIGLSELREYALKLLSA